MHTLFIIVFWIIVITAFGGITYDLVCNMIKLRKCSTDKFIGSPVEVSAFVEEQTMTLMKTKGMTQHINNLKLVYWVNGEMFTKEAELVEIMKDLKQGDAVTLVYDSCNKENALFADGIEARSVKNSIQWDIGYYVITIIIGLFLFLKIESVMD